MNIQRQRNESLETLQQLSTRAQINDNENDNSEGEDEEFGESGDYDTEDEGEDTTTKERRKKMRQSYKPPKDSIIEQELNKFQGKNNSRLSSYMCVISHVKNHNSCGLTTISFTII